jgi:hypothetical protein
MFLAGTDGKMYKILELSLEGTHMRLESKQKSRRIRYSCKLVFLYSASLISVLKLRRPVRATQYVTEATVLTANIDRFDLTCNVNFC